MRLPLGRKPNVRFRTTFLEKRSVSWRPNSRRAGMRPISATRYNPALPRKLSFVPYCADRNLTAWDDLVAPPAARPLTMLVLRYQVALELHQSFHHVEIELAVTDPGNNALAYGLEFRAFGFRPLHNNDE